MIKKLKKTFLWQFTVGQILPFFRNLQCKRKKKIVYKHIFAQNFKSLQNDKTEYIVSLTSHGDRLEITVPYALYSLFNQNEMPDKIILYLNRKKWNNSNLPSLILKFIERGLEVHFCQDVGPHTKLLPALMEYPDSTIATADDDIYYPPHWFEKLKQAHKNNPCRICCYTALKVNLNKPYEEWELATGLGEPAKFFPLGVHGVFYPKNSLPSFVADSAEFSKLAPKADDIWFWAMAALQKTEVFAIQDEFSKIHIKYVVDFIAELSGLQAQNCGQNQNEVQLNAILDRFPEIEKMFSENIKPSLITQNKKLEIGD